MQYVMVDRKLCGIFGFSCMFAKCPILLFFAFSFASCLEKTAENENRNKKAAFFAVFAAKRPFLSQIKR